ncbi:MAG: hypothetical protein E7576_08015 [Ruminococcaceae bacterium]|nr:hypothetical protein [Oscillospiraceae bacterium]
MEYNDYRLSDAELDQYADILAEDTAHTQRFEGHHDTVAECVLELVRRELERNELGSDDAVPVLSEQGPRLLALAEVLAYTDDDVLYIETAVTNEAKPAIYQPATSDLVGGALYFSSSKAKTGLYRIKFYGKTWRCWSARPTYEQRKEVPWNG